MILTLALRNLTHDRVRFIVTLTGIVFAVMLVTLQCGFFLGFITTISGVIDYSKADVWVASAGVKTFDIAMPMPESRYHEVMSVPGVGSASRMVVDFAFWKKPGGGQESIEIVAFDTHKGMGGPWNLHDTDLSCLDAQDAVIMDQLYLEKLGVSHLGQEVEIISSRARVMGFTRGIRSFTTSPYVFTAYHNGHRYSRFSPSEITYVLVKAQEGTSPEAVRDAINAQVHNVDAFTTSEFSNRTRAYWMLSTGAGAALMLTAILGFVVGMVIVAQTLYATTMDHLPEFATLKAMGAPDSYVNKVLLVQACLSAFLGYVIGMSICYVLMRLQQYSDAAITVPLSWAAGIFLVTIGMCIAASIISIRKIMHIDPAVVFRGR